MTTRKKTLRTSFATSMGCAAIAAAGFMTTAHAAEKNLYQTAKDAGSFSTLVKAIDAAGLKDALTGPGPFTVFAPTDEAFAKLPPDQLADLLKPEQKDRLAALLKGHVVRGELTAAEKRSLSQNRTLAGNWVQVVEVGDKLEAVRLNGSDGPQVSKVDIQASNGVIHVIDAVILPN